MGIIFYILSLVFSLIGGGITIYTTEYVNVLNIFYVMIFTAYIISFIFFILSIVFIRKNIRHIAIFGVILIIISIFVLIHGLIIKKDINTFIGIMLIIPSIYTYLYGFIIDMKYHNNIFYKQIS